MAYHNIGGGMAFLNDRALLFLLTYANKKEELRRKCEKKIELEKNIQYLMGDVRTKTDGKIPRGFHDGVGLDYNPIDMSRMLKQIKVKLGGKDCVGHYVDDNINKMLMKAERRMEKSGAVLCGCEFFEDFPDLIESDVFYQVLSYFYVVDISQRDRSSLTQFHVFNRIYGRIRRDNL